MLNLSWFLFYGRKIGMSKREILCTPIGEMYDMLSCLSIYEGGAKQKNARKIRMEDFLSLE